MGRNVNVTGRNEQVAPVDAVTMREWEAGTASEAGAWFSFWCWYLPAEEIQVGRRLRAMVRSVARRRALLRSPLYIAPIRGVAARVPVAGREKEVRRAHT
jgi:hypothetical protein